MNRLSPILIVASALVGVACAGATAAPRELALPAGPGRPEGCVPVSGAEALRAELEAAAAGVALCLAPGTYPGPLVLKERVVLWGPREAVIRSTGKGTTVLLEGQGAKLLGVTVDGSGTRFDKLDAAVLIKGSDAEVAGVKIVHATFGILSEQAKRIRVAGNHVVGDAKTALGMRGDGIRLWETHSSTVEENLVEDSRDLVVWYSSDNLVRRNVVRRGRYGTHFMYSHRATVEDNQYVANEVGVFVMYSRDLQVRRNLFADSQGAAGMGLGLKESGNITAANNLFIHNSVGTYFDTSPMQLEHQNVFEDNVYRLSDVAISFHSSQARNAFRRNSFRDNQAQVSVEGGGDALSVSWEGNDFDDYQGYDLDRDGVGDIPYELRDLGADLTSRYPDLAYFRGSPTLSLVSAAGDLIPLFEPTTVLRDPSPRMKAPKVELPHAD